MPGERGATRPETRRTAAARAPKRIRVAKGALKRRAVSGYHCGLDVTEFTGISGGKASERAGQGSLMDVSPFDPKSASPASLTSPWSVCSSSSNRSYLTAAMRALVIALVLLGVLALIVLI